MMHLSDVRPMRAPAHLRAERVFPTPLRETPRIPVFRRTWGSWRVSIDRAPLRRRELSARYDAVASTWGQRLDQLGVSEAYAQLMRGLLTGGPLSTLPEGAWVLDAGAGTGALSIALAAAYEEGGGYPLMFSAVDRSPVMLEVARAAFDAARLDAVLKRADVCRLPYVDDSFDLVMAGHVLEHLPSPEAGLRELVRVLQPGAPLLLLTTPRSLLGTLVHLHWRVHRIGRRDLTAWLQDCGLVDAQFMRLPGAPWCRHLSHVCIARKAGEEGKPFMTQKPPEVLSHV